MLFDYFLIYFLNLCDVYCWDVDYDVVIVGFGVVGVCVVIEVVSVGVDMLIVECVLSYGGMSVLLGGEIYFGGSGGMFV